jgi:hypothetical protein
LQSKANTRRKHATGANEYGPRAVCVKGWASPIKGELRRVAVPTVTCGDSSPRQMGIVTDVNPEANPRRKRGSIDPMDYLW